MRNAQRHDLKNESHSTNRFNDSEYERWSEGIAPPQSLKTQGGIESFLGTTENLRAGSEDVSEPLNDIGEQ